jgi:hypothetical protein
MAVAVAVAAAAEGATLAVAAMPWAEAALVSPVAVMLWAVAVML